MQGAHGQHQGDFAWVLRWCCDGSACRACWLDSSWIVFLLGQANIQVHLEGPAVWSSNRSLLSTQASTASNAELISRNGTPSTPIYTQFRTWRPTGPKIRKSGSLLASMNRQTETQQTCSVLAPSGMEREDAWESVWHTEKPVLRLPRSCGSGKSTTSLRRTGRWPRFFRGRSSRRMSW